MTKKIDWEPLEVSLDDDLVWRMISRGLTGCCFQLDKPLGQTYSEIIKPANIDQLADVLALIRPGALEVKVDGVNVPRIYANRKNLGMAATYEHEALKPILGKTQGLNIYQETSMKIATELGLFTKAEADIKIRKGIGKKLPEVIEEAKAMFVTGAQKNGIDKEQALRIFDSIEKSARYQFNASHSYAYAINNYYYSSYPKAHFTKPFFCVEMDYAKDANMTALEALCVVIEEALKMGISVRTPDIRYFNSEFKVLGDQILFGLARMRNVSKACVLKIQKKFPMLSEMKWDEMLLTVFDELSFRQGESLIMGGAFDWTGVPRARMLHENNVINSKDKSLALTKKERQYLVDSGMSIRDGMRHLVNNPDIIHEEKKVLSTAISLFNCRRKLYQLDHPHRKPIDSVRRVISWEEHVLGRSLTYNKLDLHGAGMGSYRCIDLQNRQAPIKTSMRMPVIVKDIREYGSFKKDGSLMCYFKGYDHSSIFQSFKVPAEIYEDNKSIIIEGEPLYITGELWKNPYGQQTFNISKVEKV